MLYFPARQAWDHGRAPALLDISANGFAVVSLVADYLLGIAVDVVHQGRIGRDIEGLAGRDLDANRVETVFPCWVRKPQVPLLRAFLFWFALCPGRVCGNPVQRSRIAAAAIFLRRDISCSVVG